MAGFENDIMFAKNSDYTQADNQAPTESNGLFTNGQLWIGRTAVNAGGTHIDVGTLTAGSGISITNGPGSITIANTGSTTDLHTARFIVSAGGATDGANYTTIASAITAAVAAGGNQTVFIQPGTYTEDLTLAAGIDLCAFGCDASENATGHVIILGNATFSAAGTVSIYGIQLQTNSNFFLSVTGSAASFVNLNNCYLNCTNNTGISFTTSGAGSIVFCSNCRGNINTTGISLFSYSGVGALKFYGCKVTNLGSSVTNSTASAGTLYYYYSEMDFPITVSGTADGLQCFYSKIENSGTNATSVTYTSTNAGGGSLDFCFIGSGSASAISVGAAASINVRKCTVSSTNANAITGAGTVMYADLLFTGSSSLINTTTQTPYPMSNDAVVVKAPGAYPYTTVPQDGLIIVDSSSARTIVPLASPTTGQKHIIKDNVGSAASNNITITPSGKNIDGAASFVMSTNYQSITIIYNGVQWTIN